MNNPSTPKASYSIAAVERDTGLSKDTLRVWERRYGFPSPERDGAGERVYSAEEVAKLRLVRRLLDAGQRPARIVRASAEELAAMLDAAPAAPPRTARAAAVDAGLVQLLRLHRTQELSAALHQALLRQGLQRFVAETVAPLTQAVGVAWMRGEIEVPEEHLYTEQIQNLLRRAIGLYAVAGGRPRVLLTTLPDEQHGLGLLMVEATLVPEGATCVSLGTQTPLADLCTAAEEGAFDVVALSFSQAYPARQAAAALLTMRAALPAPIALWAGGAGLGPKPRAMAGVRLIGDLDDTLAALAQWRAEHLPDPA